MFTCKPVKNVARFLNRVLRKSPQQIFFYACLSVLLIANSFAFTQASLPFGINFQAIIRNNGLVLPANSEVDFTITLRQGVSGQDVWKEAQKGTINTYGQISLVVGRKANQQPTINTSGSGLTLLDALNFAVGFWMKVEARFGIIDLGIISDQQLQAVPYTFFAANGDFPGTLKMWAGPAEKVPAVWLICDGRQLNSNNFDTKSGKKYDHLFQIIGTSWGGSGTNFRLPDFRGRFPRGVADVDSLDPDRAKRWALYPGGEIGPKVGSYQEDILASHLHPSNLENTYKEVY